MIPVQQTTYGDGKGNCLLACVASILERPLESIPDFNLSGCGWFEELYEWCRNEGLGIVLLNPKDLNGAIVVNLHCICIYTVKEHPTENHAVIGICRRTDRHDIDRVSWEADVVFDPNPKGVSIEELLHILVLFPSGVKR